MTRVQSAKWGPWNKTNAGKRGALGVSAQHRTEVLRTASPRLPAPHLGCL